MITLEGDGVSKKIIQLRQKTDAIRYKMQNAINSMVRAIRTFYNRSQEDELFPDNNDPEATGQ